jgi:hypothetical protein
MPVEYECSGSKWLGVVHIDHWRPRPPVALWFSGRTASGRTVEIIGDPYSDYRRSTIAIDGKIAEVLSPVHLNCTRRRDGGTTTIYTDLGKVHRPAPRLNRSATIDGEQLHDL